MVFSVNDIPDLKGKVALVTGGNAGVGFETVKQLARKNAKVILAARSPIKAKKAIQTIKDDYPNADVDFQLLDLSDLTSVHKAAKEVLDSCDRLDILVNNAGVMGLPYELTRDGLEVQMGTNVMGHYLLTLLLLPLLVKTAEGSEYSKTGRSVRIVHLASLGHWFSPFDASFNDFDEFNKQHWPEWLATHHRYHKSKVGNMLLCQEFQKCVPAHVAITNLSLHPGTVATDLLKDLDRSYSPRLASTVRWVASKVLTPVAQGALTQLYAATSPEVDRLGLKAEYLAPVGKVAMKRPLAADNSGKLGKGLMLFCNDYTKARLGVDAEKVLGEAGLKWPY
ncbi:short-chain dehydrogenase [Pseudozyma hubeiensis SY62]|uniref:Short-chain dehydrogenase n=1 Tax=Pseudozyma hubeiensis (strain SY62) TaxID=1305764 RepID=R9NZ58_PSEHS|nr:short-chain dehydrogenase [Pseudozyma hubeiensis SY62]GAC94021.1 short-chain dehydrogenase [Pseudozyma hubeiensis SY62]